MVEKLEMELVDPTTTDKELVESLKIPYDMLGENVLVKPLKPVIVKKTLVELDEKKNKNAKFGQELKTKEITKDVEATYRYGVVLAVGPGVNSELSMHKVNIGDTVVFHNRVSGNQFDIYRDTLLLRKYDIEAIANIADSKTNV